MSPVPFTPGFNDFFASYANGVVDAGAPTQINVDINAVFNGLSAFNAKTLRFPLDWPTVQPNNKDEFLWGAYANLVFQAAYRGFRLLPVVVNTPSWVPRDTVAGAGGLPYPTQNGWEHLGNFVAEALAYFSGVSRAIEVWNEPNLNSFAVPRETYKNMLATSLAKVAARTYNNPKTVVSASMAMLPDNDANSEPWRPYLEYFAPQCVPYAVGLHPYSLVDYSSGYSQAQAVDHLVDRIVQKYDAAASFITSDIWITETGCGSQAPFGLQGQAKALRRLAGPSGPFAYRAAASTGACKAVILHRYWTKPEPDGGVFPSYPVTYDNYAYKQPAQSYLAQDWAGAPG